MAGEGGCDVGAGGGEIPAASAGMTERGARGYDGERGAGMVERRQGWWEKGGGV